MEGTLFVMPSRRSDTALPEEGSSNSVTIPLILSNRFRRAVKYSHVPNKFRFHDLRHYYASIAHALGVPDAYIMKTGGWKSEHVMKRVYREAMDDKMRSESEKMLEHMTEMRGK